MVRCEFNKGCRKDIWLKDIGLCAQNLLSNLGSIVKKREKLHLDNEYDIHMSSKIMRQMATGRIWIC